MSEPFPHPTTGEILETREQFVAALQAVEEEMRPYWRTRARIREALSERFDAPARELRPRDRSVRQERVTRCPRCGGPLETSEEAT